MIIACPACGTRYAVPDSAIGGEGRTVRCAKCRHSWYQDGPEADIAHPAETRATPVWASPAGAAATPPADATAPSARSASAIAPDTDRGPAVDAPPPPRPMTWPDAAAGDAGPAMPPRVAIADPGGAADDAADDAASSYEHLPPFRPRRNAARMWTIAAIAFAVLALAAAAAVMRFGGGDWLPVAAASGFAQAQPDLALDFPPNRQDRRTLPDGTQFFGISGRITNIGRERRSLPNLLILLRDGHDRVVYSWEVVPARRVLGPGESENVIEAVTDIPRGAKVADIGWKAA